MRARARVVGLAALQASLGRLPAERALALLPASLHRRLRSLAAPLRVGRGRSRAFVDVEAALAALEARGAVVEQAAAPAVSVVVPTAGATRRLELALRAVAAYTRAGAYEVVVIDDASPDAAAVERALRPHPGVRLERSGHNRGFSASVNAGVKLCRAPKILVLNDDVVVTPGWLDALAARLDADSAVAWVGPTSNDTGDEASIDAAYESLDELVAFAARQHGEPREVDKLALHCALLRRSSFEAVGGLDEGYLRGMFEDDDLSMALRARGQRLLLSPETYVHHAAGATLRTLSPLAYFACFELNRRRFERRWQVRWRVREGRR